MCGVRESGDSRGISYTYMYMCLYIHVYVSIHTCICVYTYMHICLYIHVYVSPSAQESRGISNRFIYTRLSYACLPLWKTRYIYIYVCLPYMCLPLRKSQEACRIYTYICVSPIYVSRERVSRSISQTCIYMCLPLRKSQEAYRISLYTRVSHICVALFGKVDIFLSVCLAYMCLPLHKSREVNCIHLHVYVSLFRKVEKYFLFIYMCVSPVYVSPSPQASGGISYIFIYMCVWRIRVCLFGRVAVYTCMCLPLRKSRNVCPIHIYMSVSYYFTSICLCLPYMCLLHHKSHTYRTYIYICVSHIQIAREIAGTQTYRKYIYIYVFLTHMCLPLRQSRNVHPIHRYISVSPYVCLPYVCLPYMCLPLRESRNVHPIPM